MKMVTGLAYAKINLTLDVLGRRADGYHDIDSIMQMISLHDTITLSHNTQEPGIRLDVNAGPSGSDAVTRDVPRDDSNLVARAICAVMTAAGIDQGREGVSACLDKSIPTRAGLGGGSSDAATAILLTNEIYEIGLTMPEMVQIGARLGADIPFFLSGGTARVQGLGERVATVDTPPDFADLCVVLAKPAAGVSTAFAYRLIDESRASTDYQTADEGPSTLAWLRSYAMGLARPMQNDFQEIVLAASSGEDLARPHRDFERIAARHGATIPMLCGSGSAFFTIARCEDAPKISSDAFAIRGIESTHTARFVTKGTA